MRLSRALPACLIAIALLAHAPAMADGPLAVLMSVQGEVKVAGDAGKFGQHLAGGDVVETGTSGSCDILFSSGQSVHLGPGSRITVQGEAPANVGQSGGGGEFAATRRFLQLKDQRGTSAIARLRSGQADGLRALAPAQTTVRSPRPRFQWEAPEDAGELQLTVYSPEGMHWQGVTPAGPGESGYPADAPGLEAGVQYSWTLETTDPLRFPPLRSPAAFFSVMAPEEAEQLQQQLAALDQAELSDSGRALVRASLLYEHGAIGEAIASTRTAMEEVGDPALREILAQLYLEAGRSDEALGVLDGLREP